MKEEKLLKVRDLTVKFGNVKKFEAVSHVSFFVNKGETFGLVGESGSGKTTIGRSIMGIQPLTHGNVYFNNKLIRGRTPSLTRSAKHITSWIKVMIQNQNDTTKIMNDYLTDFKEAYRLYVPISLSSKSKKLTIEELAKVKIKTKAKMRKVDKAIKNNLSWLIKVINSMKKITSTIDDLLQDKNINKKDLKTICKKFDQIFDQVLVVKELENKVHAYLTVINEVNDKANEEKYDSLKHYMDDVAKNFKEMIKYHKQISLVLKQINKDIQGLSTLPNVDKDIEQSDTFRKLSKQEKHNLKKEMQMIFQDPASSLNDRMKVEQIISEGINNFPELYKSDEAVNAYLRFANKDKKTKIKKDEVRSKDVKQFLVEQILEAVGMLPEHLNRYPHEFSGGQRQRIGIARSLVMKPEFIIADEPISALDVSIRAQIINLLLKFQKEYGLTYIFIAHDLTVVKYIADRIGVIYHGKLVELATSEELFDHPMHPYTKSLLKAIPIPNPKKENNKKLTNYNPEKEHYDYLTDFPIWTEVKPGHFVYLNNRELKQIKK